MAIMFVLFTPGSILELSDAFPISGIYDGFLFFCFGRLRLNSTAFVCITAPVLNSMVLPIAVIFDEVTRRIGETFEYTENPTILDINPLASFARQVFSCK